MASATLPVLSKGAKISGSAILSLWYSPPVPKKTKSEKIVIWLFFSVLLSLLPIGINFVLGRFEETPPPSVRLISGGELFLISAAIAADAAGRAILGGIRFRILRIICGAGCILSLLAASVYFVVITGGMWRSQREMGSAIQAHDWKRVSDAHRTRDGNEKIAVDSIWLFAITGVAAFGAILVEED